MKLREFEVPNFQVRGTRHKGGNKALDRMPVGEGPLLPTNQGGDLIPAEEHGQEAGAPGRRGARWGPRVGGIKT